MKPDDVTGEMIYQLWLAVDLGQDGESTPKEIIAAAFNAVVSDDSPITAEWLVKMGWIKGYGPIYHGPCNGGVQLSWNGDEVVIISGILGLYLPTKTVGQLRCLHAGLGIGEVGNG